MVPSYCEQGRKIRIPLDRALVVVSRAGPTVRWPKLAKLGLGAWGLGGCERLAVDSPVHIFVVLGQRPCCGASVTRCTWVGSRSMSLFRFSCFAHFVFRWFPLGLRPNSGSLLLPYAVVLGPCPFRSWHVAGTKYCFLPGVCGAEVWGAAAPQQGVL